MVLDVADHSRGWTDAFLCNTVWYLACQGCSISNVAVPDIMGRCPAILEDRRGFSVARGVVNNLGNYECDMHWKILCLSVMLAMSGLSTVSCKIMP